MPVLKQSNDLHAYTWKMTSSRKLVVLRDEQRVEDILDSISFHISLTFVSLEIILNQLLII